MMFPLGLPDLILLRNGMQLEAQSMQPCESRDRCLVLLEDIDRDIQVKSLQKERDDS